MGNYIDNLTRSFGDTVDWMLTEQYSQEIKNDIAKYKVHKRELSSEARPAGVLRLLVETKVTNSYYRNVPEKFEADWNTFCEEHGPDFGTQQATTELAYLVAAHSVFPLAQDKAFEWATQLLGYPTLADYSTHLYGLRRAGRGGKDSVIGNKGADHYLRNVGYWDIVPIDIHERRFLLRTGIFHRFSNEEKQDPLDERSLQDALTGFCHHCLKGKTVEGIDLSSNPGIADLLVWFYCADAGYRVCGKVPRCGHCLLAEVCVLCVARREQKSYLERTGQQGRAQSKE